MQHLVQHGPYEIRKIINYKRPCVDQRPSRRHWLRMKEAYHRLRCFLSGLQRNPSFAAASVPNLHGRSEALQFGVVA